MSQFARRSRRLAAVLTRESRTTSCAISPTAQFSSDTRKHTPHTLHSLPIIPQSNQTICNQSLTLSLPPTNQPKKTKPQHTDAKTLPGVSAPFPDVFDPANFLATARVKDVRRWRESELTHGRVAMLAALGFVVQEQLEDFPILFNADGHIDGPAIYQFQKVEARGAVFWEPLVLAIGLLEAYRVGLGWATPRGEGFNSLKDDYEIGDLGFDPLGLLNGKSEEEVFELQTKGAF